jgi:hypothetical protein
MFPQATGWEGFARCTALSTRHSLKQVLLQHCKTYNDVFLLINSTKV